MDEPTTTDVVPSAAVAASQGRRPSMVQIAVVVAVLALAGWLVLR